MTEDEEDEEDEEQCEFCEGDGASLRPDPFALDVWDDDTPRWICDECAADRAASI